MIIADYIINNLGRFDIPFRRSHSRLTICIFLITGIRNLFRKKMRNKSENLKKSRKNENPKALWKPRFSLGFGNSKSNSKFGFENQREGKPSHLRVFDAKIVIFLLTTKFLTLWNFTLKSKCQKRNLEEVGICNAC